MCIRDSHCSLSSEDFTNPPFGYMKSSEDKEQWIVDEPATKVVRRIFDLCISGLGPTQIAKELKAEKVMTPTEYWNSIDRKCSKPPAVPFGWVADTCLLYTSRCV